MMATKTATEAQLRIVEIIGGFMEITGLQKKPSKLFATIENVGFADLIILYNRLKTSKKQFFMPGEIENENICFIYTPQPDCVIMIESEPCVKIWKGSIKLNMN